MARPKKAETTPKRIKTPAAETVTAEKPQRIRRTKEEIYKARLVEIDKDIEKFNGKIKELEAEKVRLLDSDNKKKQEKLLKSALAGGLTLEQMAEKLGVTLD